MLRDQGRGLWPLPICREQSVQVRPADAERYCRVGYLIASDTTVGCKRPYDRLARTGDVPQFLRDIVHALRHGFERASQIHANKVYCLHAGLYDLDAESTCRSGTEVVDSTWRRVYKLSAVRHWVAKPGTSAKYI